MKTNSQDILMWSVVAGFFAPLFIAFVLQCNWSTQVKRVASFAVYTLVALGITYWGGNLDLVNWPHTLLTIIFTAISGYTGRQTLWKETTDNIETLTSVQGN